MFVLWLQYHLKRNLIHEKPILLDNVALIMLINDYFGIEFDSPIIQNIFDITSEDHGFTVECYVMNKTGKNRLSLMDLNILKNLNKKAFDEWCEMIYDKIIRIAASQIDCNEWNDLEFSYPYSIMDDSYCDNIAMKLHICNSKGVRDTLESVGDVMKKIYPVCEPSVVDMNDKNNILFKFLSHCRDDILNMVGIVRNYTLDGIVFTHKIKPPVEKKIIKNRSKRSSCRRSSRRRRCSGRG
jgi:hypothetical protein